AGEPLLSLLQPIELSSPLDAIPGRQDDIAADSPPRLGNRASKVATANAELDRHKSLIALTKNIGGACIERDVGELPQRNIRIDAASCLSRHLDVLHGRDVVAVFLRQPYVNIKLPIGLEQLRRDSAAQRSLNHAIDIADVQTVARGFSPIDLDV